jgi:hypothetical protein
VSITTGGEPGLRGRENLDLPAPEAQHLPDGVPCRLVVVDHHDERTVSLLAVDRHVSLLAGPVSRAAAGSRRVNAAPAPGEPVAVIEPLWSWTIEREIERPKP